MKIIKEDCVACGLCVINCPMKAIHLHEDYATIDRDECVECYNCIRIECPTEAIKEEELDWPRSLREALSNPISVDNKSGVSGRGTAEMKTNEVTGRITKDTVGLCIELGRPGTGCKMKDVEKVCMALAKYDVYFEPLNPVTYVMEDTNTGKLKDEVLNEKVLSAIVETLVPITRLKEALEASRKVAEEIDTVFSIGLSSLVKEDGTTYFDDATEDLNISLYSGGKTNVGLGRPLAEEE